MAQEAQLRIAPSNESRKRGRKFLVSSGDAALAFESSGEVLYMVTIALILSLTAAISLVGAALIV
jgi:hypothetical protein